MQIAFYILKELLHRFVYYGGFIQRFIIDFDTRGDQGEHILTSINNIYLHFNVFDYFFWIFVKDLISFQLN